MTHLIRLLPAILAYGAAAGRYSTSDPIPGWRRSSGSPRRAGEVLSTGSCTGMLPIRAGQHVRARFGEHALVEVAFDG